MQLQLAPFQTIFSPPGEQFDLVFRDAKEREEIVDQPLERLQDRDVLAERRNGGASVDLSPGRHAAENTAEKVKKSGSQSTRRWREQASNRRSRRHSATHF